MEVERFNKGYHTTISLRVGISTYLVGLGDIEVFGVRTGRVEGHAVRPVESVGEHGWLASLTATKHADLSAATLGDEDVAVRRDLQRARPVVRRSRARPVRVHASCVALDGRGVEFNASDDSIFNISGQLIGINSMKINTETAEVQFVPSVSMDAGSIVADADFIVDDEDSPSGSVDPGSWHWCS